MVLLIMPLIDVIEIRKSGKVSYSWMTWVEPNFDVFIEN